MIHTAWTKRLCDYWKDKRLPDKCGLKVKDICEHEYFGSVPSTKFEFGKLYYLTCIKCGEFYR